MPEIRLIVRGSKPSPWANGPAEVAWRAALASSARSQWPPGSIPEVSDGARFAVEIRFHLTGATAGRADLDNLAKPVLDTIFLPRNVQVKDRSLTGAIFGVDDDRVYRLGLEKIEVPSEEGQGADIVVAW